MRTFKIIIVIGLALFTLGLLLLSASCIDLALRGCWPASWYEYQRGMSAYPNPIEYLKAMNATCAVIGSICTFYLAFFTGHLVQKLRR